MSLYPLFNTWDTKYVTVSNTWAIKDTVTSYLTKYTLCNATVSPCHIALSYFVIALCSVVFCEVPCTVLLIPFCVLYCVVDVFLEREQLVPFLKWSQQVTISVGKEKSYEKKRWNIQRKCPFCKMTILRLDPEKISKIATIDAVGDEMTTILTLLTNHTRKKRWNIQRKRPFCKMTILLLDPEKYQKLTQ